MSTTINHDRWAVSRNDFAQRIMIPDLSKAFLGRSLVVEPGTRALVIDEGLVVGEVPPGQYTLESLLARLQFWRKKQATIFLTRGEDVVLDAKRADVPCAEGLCFDVSYRWVVQVRDVLGFLTNLMGAENQISVDQLRERLSPIVGQAVWSSIGSANFDVVRHPNFVNELAASVSKRVKIDLQRYGLEFIGLHQVSVHGDDGGLREKAGEIALERRELELVRAANALEGDSLKARLEDYQNKIPIRQKLREAVTEDRVAGLQNKADLEKMVAEVDRQRLLTQEEQELLSEAFEERKEDRASLRQHLLETLDLQRERELGELQVEMNFAVQSKALEREMELAKLSRAKDADQWRAELEREREEATHRHRMRLESSRSRLEIIRDARRQKREDSWESLLHEQRLQAIREDVEIAQAERARKLAIIQAELESRLASERLEVQKRQKDWELDLDQRTASNQLEKLRQVQEMNAGFAERQQRLQLELKQLEADGEAKREADRIASLKGASVEVMIATASSGNASLLADLKKHEATQDAVKAQANLGNSDVLNAERVKLYEKLNETERAKAEAIAEAYKAAMLAQQSSVQQMIGGLAQAASPPSMGMPFGAAPPPVVTETWYAVINGQASPPLQRHQLQQYIASGQVQMSSLVWRQGMAAWTPASHCPELAGLFGGTAGVPPLPPPI